MTVQELKQEIGNIDIYLLDQILKERYSENLKILDAGCGRGRNITYFLNNQYEVYGIDQSSEAIAELQKNIGLKYNATPVSNFTVGSLEQLPYEDNTFGLVICNAVLHFAENKFHLDSMLAELARIVQSNGQLFIRVASDIGLKGHSAQKVDGRYMLPDDSVRFLMTENMMIDFAQKYDFTFEEPIKTTNVNHLRCMTTLVLRKK